MAKFQLCEFWRRNKPLNGPFKSDNPRERGIARVTDFNDHVEFIMDINGKKVNYSFCRLLNNLGFVAIDTDV